MSALPKLQEQELRYLQDQEFLRAKLRIQQSMHQLLALTAENIRQQQHALSLPAEVWEVSPKISRGENYEGLPYLVLDYPRIFLQQTTFAYRTMLWWGWGFSCTLHLGGAYWHAYQNRLLQNLSLLKDPKSWWVCVNKSPWEYHYRPDNYLSLPEFLHQAAAKEAATHHDFFKLSSRLPLAQYQQLPDFSLASLQQIAGLLQADATKR